MTKLRGVGVGMVFLVGCAVGGAAGRFVVPPANAQQTSVTRWEYFCFEEYRTDNILPKANAAGAKGWEMVGADGGGNSGSWCFKRPKL